MILIGLGSNIGTEGGREENIICALKLLDKHENIVIEEISSLYQTEPVGFVQQPDFLNCAARIRTNLPPHDLLKACLDIENKMGRVRDIRWGPRNIDLDLLVYDDLVLEDENLKLPHPRMPERAFVLIPLLDIAADFPIYRGMTPREMLSLLADKTTVKKYHSLIFEDFLRKFSAS